MRLSLNAILYFSLETEFPILENYSSPDFDRSKCSCLSMQVLYLKEKFENKCRFCLIVLTQVHLSFKLRYPLALVLISNNHGLFEVLNSCRPYVLFAIVDVANEQTLRVVTLDCSWMLKMSDMVVPRNLGLNLKTVLMKFFSSWFLTTVIRVS